MIESMNYPILNKFEVKDENTIYLSAMLAQPINGSDHVCGVYLYRVTEEFINEYAVMGKAEDGADVWIMPDYKLGTWVLSHEGNEECFFDDPEECSVYETLEECLKEAQEIMLEKVWEDIKNAE